MDDLILYRDVDWHGMEDIDQVLEADELAFRRSQRPGVNFTNILYAAFLYESFTHSFLCTYILGLYFFSARILAQKLHVECWWNWHLESISPTFYERNWANFLTPIKKFNVYFKHKKATRKMLVKLTPDHTSSLLDSIHNFLSPFLQCRQNILHRQENTPLHFQTLSAVLTIFGVAINDVTVLGFTGRKKRQKGFRCKESRWITIQNCVTSFVDGPLTPLRLFLLFHANCFVFNFSNFRQKSLFVCLFGGKFELSRRLEIAQVRRQIAKSHYRGFPRPEFFLFADS